MLKIDESQLTLDRKTEVLVTEASKIGLKPGSWPQQITLVSLRSDDIVFQRSSADVVGGELQGVRYRATTDGIRELLVIND